MELMIVVGILVGLFGGMIYLGINVVKDAKQPAQTHFDPGNQFPLIRDPELSSQRQRERVIGNLYQQGELNIEEYEDLVLYVKCGGLIDSRGNKVGISDRGYQRLQAVRRRG